MALDTHAKKMSLSIELLSLSIDTIESLGFSIESLSLSIESLSQIPNSDYFKITLQNAVYIKKSTTTILTTT